MKRVILLIIMLLCIACERSSTVMKEIESNKYYINSNKDKYEAYLSINNDIDSVIREVNVGLYRDHYMDMELSDLSKDILVLVNKYNYLTSDYEPLDLEIIDPNMNRDGYDGNNMLRHEARIHFEEMCAQALLDGVHIYNSSAYRSYSYQEMIYNRKKDLVGIKEADMISARAGSSEHQSGLAVDLNTIDDDFANTNEYRWLENNAYKYGFILRYPLGKEKITGYSYEPWHYRYVGKSVAYIIKKEGITFDEYYAYYIKQEQHLKSS